MTDKPEPTLKVGDRVELVGEIILHDESDSTFKLSFGDDPHGAWLSDTTVRAGKLLPRPLAVGDRVTWGSSPQIGTIHAIVGDRAACTWFGLSSDANGWPRLSDLERADPKEQP